MIRKLKAVVFCAIFLFMTVMYIPVTENAYGLNIIDRLAAEIFKESVTQSLETVKIKAEEYNRRLILINYRNPIPEGYYTELEEVENGHMLDKLAAESLKRMLADAREQGFSPVIISSYRTKAKQESLFKNQIQRYINNGYTYDDAFDLSRRVVAYPDTSEHQLGLAVDIVSKSYQILDTKQENTPETIWLKENCVKYGFILRYPDSKSEITEIIYEPWHYRYVGEKAAQEMAENDFCLEEYIDWLNLADGKD